MGRRATDCSQRFPIDYVEGGTSGAYDATGDLRWSGGGDRLSFDFPASSQPRFLVVNEMWDRGWTATADGQSVPVLPTNVAMRGVPIPPGASHVELTYHSLLWWAWWYVPLVAALLGLAVFVARRRLGRLRPARAAARSRWAGAACRLVWSTLSC